MGQSEDYARGEGLLLILKETLSVIIAIYINPPEINQTLVVVFYKYAWS